MLNQTELLILDELRKNSRTSIATISSKLGIPATTILMKMKKLEKAVIEKYTSIVNFQKLGMYVRVNFAIKARYKDKLEKHIIEHPNVNSVCTLSGEYDYYFETVFPDMASLYNFIESLDEYGLFKIDEHHIIEDLQREKISLVEDNIKYPKHLA